MQTNVDEIADRIYRFSTFIPEIGPSGFTFNQFLVDAEEPLLFHCGMRGAFPHVSEAVSRVIPLERLRWISFGHVEADELGALNLWLATAPQATAVHSPTGCMVSIEDMADRPPRHLADGEVLDLGGRQVRLLETPHVPHNWEAIMLFEEATGTLLCGDLGTNLLNDSPVTGDDIVEPALEADRLFSASSALSPTTPGTIRRLAGLAPSVLAIMHGASFRGDCAEGLNRMADSYAAITGERAAVEGG